MSIPTPSSPRQKQTDAALQETTARRSGRNAQKWPGALIAAILISGIILIPYHFFWRATAQASLSPQSLKMIKSGMQPTLFQAITTTTVWPPGYPALLFLGHQLHIPFSWINLSLLYVAFIISFLFLRRFFTTPWALTGVLGLTLFSFHYYNYSQFTSEALVTPLSLLLLLLLIAYKERPAMRLLLGMSFVGAVAFVSRYHILAWLLPVSLTVLLLDKRVVLKKRLSNAAIFFGVSTAPAGLYMLMNRFRTGYFTGMPRLGGYEARPPLPTQGEAAYFADQVSFSDNIRLIFKTYFLDFFSQSTLATHHANRLPYHPSSLEIIAFGIFLITVALTIFFFSRHRSQHRSGHAYEDYHAIVILMLAVSFYILITIVMWTAGNNDPIYTRFLYPSYLPLTILFLSVMAAIFHQTSRWLYRVPFLLFIVLILVNNMMKLFSIL